MAKLIFQQKCELEITVSYDEEADKSEIETEIFQQGEECEVDILNLRSDTVDVQFGDGSCCYVIPVSCVQIVQDEEWLMDELEIALDALHVGSAAISNIPEISNCTADNDNDSGEIVFNVGKREFTLALKETT